MKYFYARVYICVFIANFTAVIGRTIIYQQDFNIFIGLGYNAIKASPDIWLNVINGDDYGNFRLHIAPFLCLLWGGDDGYKIYTLAQGLVYTQV